MKAALAWRSLRAGSVGQKLEVRISWEENRFHLAVSQEMLEIGTAFKLTLPSHRASAHLETGATKVEIKKPSALVMLKPSAQL